MNKENIFFMIGVSFVLILIAFQIRSLKQDITDIKLDKCQFAMQKAIPDPNDDSRVTFLKDCYNSQIK